jgi:signal transduction histidine kinase
MTPTRVLVAEDEPIFQAALADLVAGDSSLELVGVASDADQAIEIARREKPHVALVDVRMPGGGGPRATLEIRALSPETKVLALSAAEDRDAVFGMLRAGAIGYLLKDVSPDSLIRAITHAASGQAILSRQVTADVITELVTLLNRSTELTEELETLDRTKSELVQILSHELRTPLTVIQGAAKILAKPGLNLSPEEIADISAAALRSTSRLSRLAGNVSAAAGLGREGAEIPTGVLSVNELFSKARAEFGHQSDRLVLPVEGEETSAYVSANLDLATRALVLVIENALEQSLEGQSVEVLVRPEADNVEIHVSDRGPGIPEELREHIFEPFTQVDSSSTRTHQGLGIGLYLARRIMKAHKGKLEITARTGGGSTFVLTFPSPLPDRSRRELRGGGGLAAAHSSSDRR